MKNFLITQKEFLIGLILVISLLWPLIAAPFFTHHDDVQVIRLFEMDKCFKDHQIPCRWVPDLGGVYGYPIFNFYAPLPYYFGEVIYVLTHSLIVTVKILFGFTFLGSYIFMFLLAKRFWGKLGGSLSAIFYAFAPYHAVDFYVRGAMGEMWALMLFPAIFWALSKLEEKTNIANLLLSTFFLGAILVSHNLSLMIFSPFIFIWVCLLFLKRRVKKFLLFSLLSLSLAILLSSFYLFPMIFEKNLVHVDTTTSGYFSYTEHFKGIRKLFIERFWGWGASVREVPGGEKDGLSFQIGWVHLLGWVIAVVTAMFLWKKNRWLSGIIIFSSFGILLSVFMINPKSELVWKSIEVLKYLQFPWRFLMLVTFFISFICGSVVLIPLKKVKYLYILLIILVVALNFSYFRPEKFIQTSDAKLLRGADWDKQIKRSIFDYLPIYAKEPPAELATKRYEILTGDSKVYDFKEGTNWINFKIETKTHTIIRLSQYYFPDWRIVVDGSEIKFDYKNNTLGLMTFILGVGNHKVEARLYDTPIRLVSNFVTLTTLVIILLLLISQSSKARKWVGYYRKRIN